MVRMFVCVYVQYFFTDIDYVDIGPVTDALGPILLTVSLHRHFPDQSQCYDWTDLCGSYDYKAHLSNYQETLKKKDLLLKVLEGTWHAIGSR